MSERNILFIHYHYPPMHNSGVYRNYFMSQAIANGYSDTAWVLTTDNVKLFSQDPLSFSKKMWVESIYTIDYRTIIAKLFHNTSVGGSQFSEEKKRSNLYQFAIKVQRSFPFFLFFAEGSILYIFNAYRRGSALIKNENITIIYSSFMPYADHVVAWMLKKKHPNVKWVADFRDLHIEPIYKNILWPGLQRWFEKIILRQADVITSVSEGLSNKLKDYHANVLTLTKGVNIRPAQTLYDTFTISYVGGLFLDFRDPRPVFKAIQTWRTSAPKAIRFRYVGKDGRQMRTIAIECGIEDIFEDEGFVKREQASLVQDRSHMNLLLTSSSQEHKGVLTGKLFDYIESRRPVLCMINGVYDEELEAFFRKYNLGKIFYPDQEMMILKYIDDLYIKWKNTGTVAGNSDVKLLTRSLSWEVQAMKLIAAVGI